MVIAAWNSWWRSCGWFVQYIFLGFATIEYIFLWNHFPLEEIQIWLYLIWEKRNTMISRVILQCPKNHGNCIIKGINTLMTRQMVLIFAVKCNSVYEYCSIFISILLRFVPRGLNEPSLDHIMAWCRRRGGGFNWTTDGLVYWRIYALFGLDELTHWGRNKMDAISQTTSSSAFSWMKMFEFRLKFHEVCS